MTNIIKQYRRRIESKAAHAWEERMAIRDSKKQMVQMLISAEVATQITPPPVHAPHVIFEKSYLADNQTGDVRKVSEELRHLSYHNHHAPQLAY
jgi:hypothetical protein